LKAVKTLKAGGLSDVEAIQIDVTDFESVKAARVEIGKKTDILDALINNAGINGGMPQSALEANIDQFKKLFDTNLYGVV